MILHLFIHKCFYFEIGMLILPELSSGKVNNIKCGLGIRRVNRIHRVIIYWGAKKGNNTEMASGTEPLEIKKTTREISSSCSSSGWRIKTTVWVNSARSTRLCHLFSSSEPPTGPCALLLSKPMPAPSVP